MSDPVLDTIDHVLHDYEVSEDAMRWTPDPQPALPRLDPEAIRQAMQVASRAAMAYREAFARFAQKMAELIPRMSELGQQIKEAQAVEQQHQLHVAYRRRTRRRNRR